MCVGPPSVGRAGERAGVGRFRHLEKGSVLFGVLQNRNIAFARVILLHEQLWWCSRGCLTLTAVARALAQVSAKNGYGVSDAFYTLAVDIVQAMEAANRTGADERRGTR